MNVPLDLLFAIPIVIFGGGFVLGRSFGKKGRDLSSYLEGFSTGGQQATSMATIAHKITMGKIRNLAVTANLATGHNTAHDYEYPETFEEQHEHIERALKMLSRIKWEIKHPGQKLIEHQEG